MGGIALTLQASFFIELAFCFLSAKQSRVLAERAEEKS
jgi:thermostable 8-oxoguanine DNA glycosylase